MAPAPGVLQLGDAERGPRQERVEVREVAREARQHRGVHRGRLAGGGRDAEVRPVAVADECYLRCICGVSRVVHERV